MSTSNDIREPDGRLAAVLLAVIAVVLTAVAAVFREPGQNEAKADLAKTRFDVPHQRQSNEFATSNACRSCHPAEYSSWHDSYHRTMTQIATPEAVAAPFEDVELQDGVLTCRLERRGNEFWATVFETNWKQKYLDAGISPESVIGTTMSPFLTRKVELTTGSHHMQVYWVSHRGQMLELPFYYHIDGHRWIPRDDSVLAPPGDHDSSVRSSEWRLDCIKCHSVGGRPGLSVRGDHLQSTVAEFGISCEACHGPATEHIRHHQNPVNRYRRHFNDSGDPTIVNPARLSHTRSTQVCGQCHISFNPRDNEDFLRNGLQYRAGDKLETTHDVQQFTDEDQKTGGYTTYWGDGTCCVGGDEYLGIAGTACHLRGEMSCLSCHSMHQSDPNDQLRRNMDGDQACLQCHTTFAEDIPGHTHHAAESSGSRCYNCHMPHTTYALFTAMRSHRVDSPDAGVSIRTGRPNACNLCHLDRTLEWTAIHLNRWFDTPVVEMNQDEKTIAASLLWLMRGNAIQRLIAAWHMGWEPAHQASGNSWQAPFLAQILEDPYSMVRYVAHQSLSKLPGLEGLKYDYIGPAETRRHVHQNVLKQWQQQSRGRHSAPEHLLLTTDGDPDRDEIERLLQQRDDTPMVISE
ncbi:MAG: cytochrome c3 family protein [Fuerstiella sp.]